MEETALCSLISPVPLFFLSHLFSDLPRCLFFFFRSCSQVPHFKVAPEEFIKFQFQRFTTLNLHPSNTDISVAVAGVLNFFNCTTACLICAKAECKFPQAGCAQTVRSCLCQPDWFAPPWLETTPRRGGLSLILEAPEDSGLAGCPWLFVRVCM